MRTHPERFRATVRKIYTPTLKQNEQMIFTTRKIILFICVLAVPLALLAEKISDVKKSEKNYIHTHYDDHNGMSQWHLTKVLQDARGFMWFSTWNGLNRFDGYDFAVFKSKPGDGNNLTSDRIRNMMLGEDGNIYCVNNDMVWRFNLRTYKFETVDSVLQERYLARMNYDTSVYTQPRSYTYGDYTFDDIRQNLQDSQKNYWLMGRFGVEKLSPSPLPAVQLSSVPRSTVRALFRDHKKRIWVGTRDANVVVVLDSLANLIGYLGTDGRLHKEPVQFHPSYCIYQQRNGIYWIGSKPDGMFRLRETAEGQFQIDNFVIGTPEQVKAGTALNCSDIYDFQEDAKGRLWIATQGGGLNILMNPEAPLNAVRFCNNVNAFPHYPKTSVLMRRLLTVGKDLVFATTTEGLLVIDNVQGDPRKFKFTLHQRESVRESSLSCSATMDLLIDRKGRLFVSTESGGVNMLQTADLRAEQYEFKHFDTGNGMGSDAALAMTEIGDEILIQCNNQVTRINADLGKLENFNDKFFSTTSRFSDAEPILLSDGHWLLSLENGVLVVPEQLFHQRLYVPRIVFTSFDMPNQPADYSADNCDTLVLSSERDVTVSYAALDYTDNSNIKYINRVIEQGHWWSSPDTTEWSTPQENRSITLYNLSPGTYTLEICSTNAEGLWVDNIRRLTIVVEPMFWETTFAYILYTLFFILVVAGITYTVTYIKNLKRQREENLQAYLKLFEANTAGKSTDEEEAQASLGIETKVEEGMPETSIGQHAEPHLIVSSPIINEEDDAFMRRLLQFVDENLGNSDVGVGEMAVATATSRSNLNRKMKQLLGVTPADFLKEARMKRAKQLLATTMRGVNEIAYNCGFSDPKYFSKCFKSSLGMSPSEYRNSMQHSSQSEK